MLNLSLNNDFDISRSEKAALAHFQRPKRSEKREIDRTAPPRRQTSISLRSKKEKN